jgi:hypothetical protein
LAKKSLASNNIYLAIASYRDSELVNTVYSALANASDRQRIFFYIFSQDDEHPRLESLFDLFGTANYFYDKEHHSLSRGVGYARSRAQRLLSKDYTYYLQVDSHTQFSKDWDSRLILDYENLISVWGNYIFSTYPPAYTYEKFGDIKFETDGVSPAIRIRPTTENAFGFEPKYADYYGGTNGQEAAYFCAGFAFGYSKFFIQAPYDRHIYFHGEEHTLSLRFYDNGVKIVCPPSVYLFHDYEGSRRKRNWEDNPNWGEYEDNSAKRIEHFLNGDYLDGYGLSSIGKYHQWISCYVSSESL